MSFEGERLRIWKSIRFWEVCYQSFDSFVQVYDSFE